MPVTKYFPRIWSSPKQKEQIFFKCDPTLQRPLRVCVCKSTTLASTDPIVPITPTGPKVTAYNISGTKFASGNGLGVAYGNGVWIAVGIGINKLLYSSDGQTWSIPALPLNPLAMASVIYRNNLWVAAGLAGIYYSLDNGNSWTAVASPPVGNYTGVNTDIKSISYGNGVWICPRVATNGYSNAIARSTDGINWSSASGTLFTISGTGNYATYANNTWVAVGRSVTTSNIIYSEDQGINWSAATGSTISSEGKFVMFGNNIWIAVGQGTNKIVWSEDGKEWTAATVSVGTNVFTTGYSVAYGDGLWVAVGEGGDTILWSEDGKNWSAATGYAFSSKGISVIFENNIWIAVGEGTYKILWSDDGKIWRVPSGSTFLSKGNSIAFGDNKWIAVGSDGGTPQGTNTILKLLYQ